MKRNRSSIIGLVIVFVLGLGVLAANWRSVESRYPRAGTTVDLDNPDIPPTIALTTQAGTTVGLDNPDIPPTIALTTQVVGPLRGLISNGLWWRAVRLQDEGNYFEAIQLADWISSLQPKLTRVWTYQSWNMAYNISAEIEDREGKWQWILQGISLLRDKGLRYNPRDFVISTEIGQTIMQKVGNDPGNSRYFQLQWAKIMSRYLQAGDHEELEAIVEAPDQEDKLRAAAGVAALLEQADRVGVDLFDLDLLQGREERLAQLTGGARELLASEEHAAARELVRLYLVKKGLREEAKLDSKHMLVIDKKYGPFDWRLYHAHVVYWCARESYEAYEGREDYHHGYVRQAIVESFYDGQLLFFDDNGMSTGPNLGIIKNAHDYLAEYLDQQPGDSGARGLNKEFHEWAIPILYTSMYEHEAEELFEDYKENFLPVEEREKWTFESFVEAKAPELLKTSERTRRDQALVMMALQKAFYWAASGDEFKGKGFENLAKVLWRGNQKRYVNNPDRQLPPLTKMRKDVLAFMVGPGSRAPKPVKDRLQALVKDGGDVEIKATGTRKELNLGDPTEAHGH